MGIACARIVKVTIDTNGANFLMRWIDKVMGGKFFDNIFILVEYGATRGRMTTRRDEAT